VIAVVDYGMSNLRSVERALVGAGAAPRIVSDPDQVRRADAVVLPGQGEFKHCMRGLAQSGMREAIVDFWQTGRPFLGICIGLQILFPTSEEAPECQGLGRFQGAVRRFAPEPQIKIPHMGWNVVEIAADCPLLRGLPPRSHAYFVHSYYVQPNDPAVIVGLTQHGSTRFASAIWSENLVATQFHPEKSQHVGLLILENFLRWRP